MIMMEKRKKYIAVAFLCLCLLFSANSSFALESKSNLALNFDPLVDAFVSIADDESIRLTDDFSVALWMKPTESDQAILGKSDEFELRMIDASLYAFFNVGGTWLTVKMPVIMNQWNHVAVVLSYDEIESEYKLHGYINGISGSKQRIYKYGELADTHSELYVGTNSNKNSFYRGGLDDLMIYQRALESAEISALKVEAPDLEDKDLGLYLNFNEENLDDSSANSNNGENSQEISYTTRL